MTTMILAIATSGPNGGLALQSEDGALLQAPLAAGRGRGRDVMPAIERLLGEAGVGVDALTELVVDVGPGSFTGVRVGVTVAKTLAWSLGLPVRAVNSLELLASAAPEGSTPLAVRDAGRGTVYVRTSDGELGRHPGAELQRPDGVTLVGEEARALAERFGWTEPARDVTPGAAELLAQVGTLVDAHALAPLYLQASAPERKAAGEVS